MADRDVRLRIYEAFPHGFLQFDNPVKHMPYCREAVKEIEQTMARLLRRH